MGYWYSRTTRKFYEQQVERIRALIQKSLQDNIDVDKYLQLCEQLGKDPDPNELPVEMADFPFEVQEAFNIFNLLPDRWDGMNGTYLGKDWSALESLLNIFQVEEKRIIVMFIKYIEVQNIKKINDEQKRKSEAAQRRAKAKSGGINVSNGKKV